MTSDFASWSTHRLGDLCAKIASGATPRGGAEVYVDAGTALIRSQNIYDDRFSWPGLAYISDAAAEKLEAVSVCEDDVLINITGESVARVNRAPAAVLPARVNQHVAILRPKPNGCLDSRYLHYALIAPEMKRHLLALASAGATRKALTKGMLEDLVLRLPPRAEQGRIASVLASLEGKIESNGRVSETLLNVARAFLDRAIATDGAESTVGEHVEFHNRRRRPLSAQERLTMPGDVPYYGATGVFDHVAEALFDEILVLVGEDGTVVRPDGSPVVQYIWGPAWVNNHAHVLTGRGISTELAMLVLQRARVAAWVTGAVQPKLSMKNLRQVPVVVPGHATRVALEEAIASLFSALRGLADESRMLRGVHNALLPKLISGAIQVRPITHAGPEPALAA